jgi:hypothetical protein
VNLSPPWIVDTARNDRGEIVNPKPEPWRGRTALAREALEAVEAAISRRQN